MAKKVLFIERKTRNKETAILLMKFQEAEYGELTTQQQTNSRRSLDA